MSANDFKLLFTLMIPYVFIHISNIRRTVAEVHVCFHVLLIS